MSKTLREQLAPLLAGSARGEYLRCRRKCRYGSRAFAEQVRARRQPEVAQPLYVHFCELCGGWHLTKLRPPSESADGDPARAAPPKLP